MTRPLAATTSLKYQAVFMLAYGAGLRVSEVAALQITAIQGADSSGRPVSGNTWSAGGLTRQVCPSKLGLCLGSLTKSLSSDGF